MKLKRIPASLVMLPLLLLIGACRKDHNETAIGSLNHNTMVYVPPTSAAEKEMVSNIGKITEVFMVLYKDSLIRKEVNAAIGSKTYDDESVLLKDLVTPGTSLLAENQLFREKEKKEAFSFGHFSGRFWKEIRQRKDPQLLTFVRSLEDRASEASRVSVYFPYHDVFALGSETITLVPATADADEGIGYRPYYEASGDCRYKEVLVNDHYAMLHPTRIIGVNGTRPLQPAALQSTLNEDPRTAAPPLSRPVKQVFINDVRCRKQYDALISFTGNGGGSEIRFTRGDGFLKAQDGQVQPADIYIMGEHTSISRRDIKKAKWVNYGLMWDEDWEANNIQQFLAIFEEDNRNEWNLDFGVKTTVKKIEDVNVDGNIDGSLRFKSDDFVIRQTNYSYDVFFAMNRMNPEGEMYNGWPVRDRNALVSFTFADQAIE